MPETSKNHDKARNVNLVITTLVINTLCSILDHHLRKPSPSTAPKTGGEDTLELQFKRPNYLTEAEYRELAVLSAIHPEIIERNFLHIEGETVYEYLFFSDQIPRKNAGRVTDGFLKQYSHASKGGLWISGLDPQNNWEPMQWGRFKPTEARINEKGKPVKYESPPKTPNRVAYFEVTEAVWDEICKKYNIKRYHSPLMSRLKDRQHLTAEFWMWVILHPEIPIILCEGEKKAACMLSQGYVAIAVPGIWGGRVGKKDIDERLHPDLLPLAQPGREFIILFDYETAFQTRWSVFQATVRTGKAIEAAGCTCSVAQLPGPEKGVDDFVVAHGKKAPEQLNRVIDDAKSLKDYQDSFCVSYRGLSKRYTPDVTVNVKYLSHALGIKNQDDFSSDPIPYLPISKRTMKSDSDTHPPFVSPPPPFLKELIRTPYYILPESGTVVLLSGMGTGKTKILVDFRRINPDVRFLSIGHRVNLLKNLAERLGTEIYSALDYGDLAKASALSITIDSLHKLNTAYLKYGCVFIDEACQFLTHLLHSKTCKEYRAQILEVLEYIVYNAKLLVIADAHMDDKTIDFFMAMRPPGEIPYIIKNKYLGGGRTVYLYEGNNVSALVAQISAHLMAGKKVMVVSSSKRFVKQLECLLTMPLHMLPDDELVEKEEKDSLNKLIVWSIHSENSGSEENVAFIKDITHEVKNVDALIVSPSLGTGVDIAEYHFDAVFGAFYACSQAATDCAQQLHRYRPNVPLHIWVSPRPIGGYKETNASKIKERMLQTNEITAFLIRINRETGKRGVEKDWALDAYCKILAARNRSINNLRADLYDLLTSMGYTLVRMGDAPDETASEDMKKAGITLDEAHNIGVANSKPITETEYRNYQNQDYIDPLAILSCEKFRIKEAYGMDVTPELVAKDDKGGLIKRIITLEAVLSSSSGTIPDPENGKVYPLPPKIVADKDRAERSNLRLCFDWKNHSAVWLALSTLGVPGIVKRLVDGQSICATDPDLVKMTKMALACSVHIKPILGFTVPDDCQPIWLLGTLLDHFGLKQIDHKEGPKGKQVKYYSLCKPELDFALSVIAYRKQKRDIKEERARRDAEEQARHQAFLAVQYRDRSSYDVVSTPPTNAMGNPIGEGVDTKGKEPEPPSEPQIGDDLEPLDGDPTPIQTCVEQLREGIKQGVETVKALFKSWGEDRRWCAVLLLEKIAESEKLILEQMIPDFYTWMGEPFSST
jgi:Domain of unknown function (DUF3854)